MALVVSILFFGPLILLFTINWISQDVCGWLLVLHAASGVCFVCTRGKNVARTQVRGPASAAFISFAWIFERILLPMIWVVTLGFEAILPATNVFLVASISSHIFQLCKIFICLRACEEAYLTLILSLHIGGDCELVWQITLRRNTKSERVPNAEIPLQLFVNSSFYKRPCGSR